MQNLTGLPVSLGGINTFYVESNDSLTSLNGAPSLQEVTDLFIGDNDNLESLAGLSGIAMVIHSLIITGNAVLSDLTGLPPAIELETLSISDNNTMLRSSPGSGLQGASTSNLDALAGLESVSGNVGISSNPTLSDCSSLITLLNDVDDGDPGPGPGVDGIPDVLGFISIEQNLPGCNSIAEILGGVDPDKLFEDGFESPNQSIR